MAVVDPTDRIDVALDQVAHLLTERRRSCRTRTDLIAWALDVAGLWREIETAAIARADAGLRAIARAEYDHFVTFALDPPPV